MIRFEQVSKAFDAESVLRDISFELQPGCRMAVEGASGSGKTTLLNLAMGLLKPDSGMVDVRARRMAAVFQEDRLIEHMSARDNVRLAARHASAKEIDAALRAVDLDEGKKPVRAFSGGQRRRVAIVRAVLSRPELLFLDEPFQGLDGETRKKTATFILEGCPHAAMILVSHDAIDIELLKIERIIRLQNTDPAPAT